MDRKVSCAVHARLKQETHSTFMGKTATYATVSELIASYPSWVKDGTSGQQLLSDKFMYLEQDQTKSS